MIGLDAFFVGGVVFVFGPARSKISFEIEEEPAPGAFEFFVGGEGGGEFRRGHVVLLAGDDRRFRELRFAQRQSRARDHHLCQREHVHDVSGVGVDAGCVHVLERVGDRRVVFDLFVGADGAVGLVEFDDGRALVFRAAAEGAALPRRTMRAAGHQSAAIQVVEDGITIPLRRAGEVEAAVVAAAAARMRRHQRTRIPRHQPRPAHRPPPATPPAPPQSQPTPPTKT